MKRLLLAFAGLVTLLTACSDQDTTVRRSTFDLGASRYLRLNIGDDPATLDPRKARDLASNSLCAMIFEGLTRLGPDGQPELAVAKSVDVSEDGKLYTFELHELEWSNGDPLTAFDFVTSWRTMLDPMFPAPQADKLYAIKNGKDIKEGFLAAESLGARAVGDYILTIELDQPTPYFLELTAFRAYLPINSNVERTHPQWATRISDGQFSCNGPFIITEWKHHDHITLMRNPRYREADSVKLPGIELSMVSSETAFQMFEQGELDWAGSPLDQIPTDSISSLRSVGLLHEREAKATEFFRFNTTEPPFNNQNVRKALSLALDRNAIVEHLLEGTARVAYGFIPPSSQWPDPEYPSGVNLPEAQRLFALGLEELGIKKEDLPPITIAYANYERKHLIAQAVQQDWQNALGVEIVLEAREGAVLWNKLANLQYQIIAGSWFADIKDPIDLLNIFRTKDIGTNNTGWEDPVYEGLLEMSERKKSPSERLEILQLAEKLLIEEMPLLPIFHYSFNYVKNEDLNNAELNSLGQIEVRTAHFR